MELNLMVKCQTCVVGDLNTEESAKLFPYVEKQYNKQNSISKMIIEYAINA